MATISWPAGEGNDTIYGGAGDDKIAGGAYYTDVIDGDDYLDGWAGDVDTGVGRQFSQARRS